MTLISETGGESSSGSPLLGGADTLRLGAAWSLLLGGGGTKLVNDGSSPLGARLERDRDSENVDTRSTSLSRLVSRLTRPSVASPTFQVTRPAPTSKEPPQTLGDVGLQTLPGGGGKETIFVHTV